LKGKIRGREKVEEDFWIVLGKCSEVNSLLGRQLGYEREIH